MTADTLASDPVRGKRSGGGAPVAAPNPAGMSRDRSAKAAGAETPVRLSILVPTYRDDASALVASLAACHGAEETELVIFDDGSSDPALAKRHEEALKAFPGDGRLIVSPENVGRGQARNRLLAAARSDWVLLIDADMLPDDHLFLSRYFDAIGRKRQPALVAGGFSLKRVNPGRDCQLHAAQSRASECVPADVRRTSPGRFVFSSNILVHRTILDGVPFDTGFTGWGWEDTDWGLRVAGQHPVCHIDNTATHLGLDRDADLIAKYAGSGRNFARMVQRHPEAACQMPLHKAARRMRALGILRPVAGAACRLAASSAVLPIRARLAALKLFRALVYSREL